VINVSIGDQCKYWWSM